jgi:serine/threonine-protein kinase
MRELMAALGPFRRRSSTRPLVPSLAEMAATSARQRSELSGAPTLAAAETESARIRGAIGAGARAAAAASDRTVLSAESHSTGRSKPPPKQRRIVLFAGTGLVIALSAALLARLASSPDSAALSAASQSAISPPTAAPARSSTFSLLIESTPSGAEVFEAGRLLGKTPLHLVVDKHAAQKDARTLTLRHPGYQSYSVVQGSSEENVRLVAVLVPEPALSEVVPPPSRSRASKPTRIRQTPERTAAPAPVDTDIRMQR